MPSRRDCVDGAAGRNGRKPNKRKRSCKSGRLPLKGPRPFLRLMLAAARMPYKRCLGLEADRPPRRR